jgi:hypothetical protein
MPQLSIVEPVVFRRESPAKSSPAGAISKLARLHAEAEETARLANFLGRSLYAAVGLVLLAVLAAGLADGADLTRQLVWCGFVGAASLAVGIAYAHAIRRPFERAALKDFAKDISAILLFAGFAWGAGAFLALPAETGVLAAILFAVAPSAMLAVLLREPEAILLFLAPVTALTAFASVLRPFADGALAAGLILIAAAGLAAGIVMLQERREAEHPIVLPVA